VPSGRVMQKNSNTFSQNLVRSPLDMSSGGGFVPLSNRPKGGKKGVEDARLETTAKSVGQISAGRSDRFRWQRHAAGLLGGRHRVGLCRWSVVSKSAGVDVVSTSYPGANRSSVHYEGLQTCGSVWACPCCSSRISETRREEMGHLLSWARARGYFVRMVTLTCRHGSEDDLADLLLRMKGRSASKKTGIKAYRGAKQRMVDHRSYKDRVKPHVIGSVTATEVTGGGFHGWHPHMHMILILDQDIDLTPMRDAWLASLRGVGLEGTGQGWDVREADQTGEYIAKWGAAEELTLGRHKKGRGRTGRTPAQLLAASSDEGDKTASELWAEYATVFHGRRQLVWSPKLKDMVGLKEIDDKKAAEDEKQEGQVETGRANLPHEVWRDAVCTKSKDRRADVMDRVDEVGVASAVDELISGHVPEDDVFEEVFQPHPGGLASRVLASISMPGGGTDQIHEDFQSTALPYYPLMKGRPSLSGGRYYPKHVDEFCPSSVTTSEGFVPRRNKGKVIT
jgi:hypothetical protein